MLIRVLAVCFAVGALAALTGAARADPPRELWALDGFDAPKSVLYDARTDSYFVSNVNGDPTLRDGNGYISQVSSDGRLLHKIWFPGLNAPKGMAIHGDYLFVADIDQLVVIDKLKAKLLGRHPARASISPTWRWTGSAGSTRRTCSATRSTGCRTASSTNGSRAPR